MIVLLHKREGCYLQERGTISLYTGLAASTLSIVLPGGSSWPIDVRASRDENEQKQHSISKAARHFSTIVGDLVGCLSSARG